MGKQSSRIIWGRTGEKENEKTPVTLYDPVETIYVKNNMAIVKVKDEDGKETPTLFICKTIESAGEWNTVKDDWRQLRSVGVYDTKKAYKKGAKCIYQNFYWSCTREITKGDILIHLHDDELVPTSELYWEKVNQTVAVEYHAMDHKEVYYDNGHNECKWHKAMWFVPDEDWFDVEHEEEIAEWNPNRQYEHVETKKQGDRVIKTFSYISGEVKKLYECRVRHTTAGDTSWHPEQWTLIDDIAEWEPNVSYAKDSYVIRSDVPVGEFVVVRFGAFGEGVSFKEGDKCINIIDKSDAESTNPDIRREYFDLPIPIKNKIEKVGTNVSGVYQLRQGVKLPNLVEFQREEWVLTTQAFSLFVGEDIAEGQSVIWSYKSSDAEIDYAIQSDSVFTALSSMPGIKPEETPTADPSKWGPAWKQEQKAKPQNHVYRAKKNLTPNMNSRWRKENWVICTQMMKTNELDCYGWVWKKLSDRNSHGAAFGNFFPTYGGSRYTYDSKDNTDRRGRLGSFYLTSTNAIFESPTTYSFHTKNDLLNDFQRIQVTGGTGFSFVKTFMSMAYGFPLWSSLNARDYGKVNFTLHEYINYIYVRLFDGWTKINLSEYIAGDLFTPIGNGFQAYTEFAYSLDEYRNNKKRIKKVVFSESSEIGILDVPFQLTDSLDNYISVYDSDSGVLGSYFTDGNFVLFTANKRTEAPHFWNLSDYTENGGVYSLNKYSLREFYVLDSTGDMVCYETAPYLYENMFNAFDKPSFIVDFLKSHVGKEMYNDTEITNSLLISQIGASNLRVALLLDDFDLIVDTSDEYTRYFAHGWYSYLYNQNTYDSFIFSSANGSTAYRLWHLSYTYKPDTSSKSIVRAVFWLQVFSWFGTVSTYNIYDESEELNSGQTVLNTSLPMGKMYRIGRVNGKYYFAIGSANGYVTGYHEGSGIYELDIEAQTISKIKTLETRQKFEDGMVFKGIRYINNGSVELYDYWGHGGPVGVHHKVSKLNIYLSPDFVDQRNDYVFDDEDESLSICIPLVDNNSFSVSAGSAAGVYTGDIFLHDYFDLYHTFGIFVHIRNFNIRDLHSTAFQSFFWMSAGNDSDQGRDYGDFYGGFDRSPYEFNLPIVF